MGGCVAVVDEVQSGFLEKVEKGGGGGLGDSSEMMGESSRDEEEAWSLSAIQGWDLIIDRVVLNVVSCHLLLPLS